MSRVIGTFTERSTAGYPYLYIGTHTRPDDVREGWLHAYLPMTPANLARFADVVAALHLWRDEAIKAHGPRVSELRVYAAVPGQEGYIPLARWRKSDEGKRYPRCPGGVKVARIRAFDDFSCRVEGYDTSDVLPAHFPDGSPDRRLWVDWIPACGGAYDRTAGLICPDEPRLIEWPFCPVPERDDVLPDAPRPPDSRSGQGFRNSV